jgi:hypothetical protein
MIGFRLSAQRPPEPRRINDTVVMRFDHVYEVDPSLMQEHVRQHDFPAWETRRIVDSRWGPPGLDACPLGRRRDLRGGAARRVGATGARSDSAAHDNEGVRFA